MHQRCGVAQPQVQALAGHRVQRLRGIADAHGGTVDQAALGDQTQREVLQRRQAHHGAGGLGQQAVQHADALRVAERCHRVVVAGHAPHQGRAGAAVGRGGQRQQRQRAIAGEALDRQAGRGADQRGSADPGGLPVVMRDGGPEPAAARQAPGSRRVVAGTARRRPGRTPHLVGEDAAFGDHRQVEALGDAGVHLDATIGQVAQVGHRPAEAAVQALRRQRLGRLPGALQASHQRAVSQHGAQHGHGLVAGAQVHGVGHAAQAEGGRRLRNHHLGDGLHARGRPGAQPLQQLHAAQRQRQRAGVARHVLVSRPGIEQADLGPRQPLGSQQRQGQPGRAGADDGNPPQRQERDGGQAHHCSEAGRRWPSATAIKETGAAACP